MSAGPPRPWLSPLLVWIIPAGVLLAQVLLRLADTGQGFYEAIIETEHGLIETATALALLPAAAFGLVAAARWRRRRPGLALWLAAVTAVALLYCGEEVSWGQHWLGFDSPAVFAEHNRQGETNIHNLHLQLGRAVKTLVTAAIIVAGLVVPLGRRDGYRGTAFWPGLEAVPTAALVLGVRLVERFQTWFDLAGHPLLEMNLKETNEFHIAWFFLVYLWAQSRRAAQATG